MNTQPNDNNITDNPQLTAYALGDLEAQHIPAIEKLIADNPEAAQFVADIQQTAGFLTTELLADTSAPAPLTDEQREALDVAANQPPPTLAFPSPVGYALAAVLALCASAGVWTTLSQPSNTPRSEVAFAQPAGTFIEPNDASSHSQITQHALSQEAKGGIGVAPTSELPSPAIIEKIKAIALFQDKTTLSEQETQPRPDSASLGKNAAVLNRSQPAPEAGANKGVSIARKKFNDAIAADPMFKLYESKELQGQRYKQSASKGKGGGLVVLGLPVESIPPSSTPATTHAIPTSQSGGDSITLGADLNTDFGVGVNESINITGQITAGVADTEAAPQLRIVKAKRDLNAPITPQAPPTPTRPAFIGGEAIPLSSVTNNGPTNAAGRVAADVSLGRRESLGVTLNRYSTNIPLSDDVTITRKRITAESNPNGNPIVATKSVARPELEKRRGLAVATVASIDATTLKKNSTSLNFEAGTSIDGLDRKLESIRSPQPNPTPRNPRLLSRAESTNESYLPIIDNPFKLATAAPLSTFSIDVDTGAYTNARRFISRNQLPPRDSVRIEEMINYFSYNYAAPIIDEEATNQTPFSTHVEIASAPWDTRHRLVRVGLKGLEMDADKRPPSNLVFLLDVSGSMSNQDKLPLLQKSMKMLVDNLTENDRVAIVVYAGASGLILDSTTASNKTLILEALERLSAGGSTNGGAGIELAYNIATQNFITGGVNRVILATDGDFNVGTTSHASLMSLIENKRKSGVFLSVLGFGTGNLKDSTMEQLANKGNGAYHYIDRLSEGRRVLVEQAAGTLVTIAKDVKIQVEFNPAIVQSYRLIGYENRVMAAKDFNDDTKDAGEIGAGHTVTALYEIVPTKNAANQLELPDPTTPLNVDPLKYQSTAPATTPQPVTRELTDAAATGEMLTVKLRYKLPDEDVSTKIEIPVTDTGASFQAASTDFRFASSVASFGMILRQSPHRGDATLRQTLQWAQDSIGQDQGGYRREFIDMVNTVDQMR